MAKKEKPIIFENNEPVNDGIIDQKTIEDADLLTVNLSKLAAKNKDTPKRKENVNFGYFGETQPDGGDTYTNNQSNRIEPLPNDRITPIITPMLSGEKTTNDPYNKDINEIRRDPSYNPEPELKLDMNSVGNNKAEEENKKKEEKTKVAKPKKDIKVFPIIMMLVGILVLGSVFAPTIIKKLKGSDMAGGATPPIVNETTPQDDEELNEPAKDGWFEPQIMPIQDPNSATAEKSLVFIDSFTTGLNNYYKEIIKIVKETKDGNYEDKLKPLKIAYEKDLNNLKDYNQVFINFNGIDLFKKIEERYYNVGFVLNSTKNTMTVAALVDNVNTYIEKENNLNAESIDLLKSYLDVNNFAYNVSDQSIVYVPVQKSEIQKPVNNIEEKTDEATE